MASRKPAADAAPEQETWAKIQPDGSIVEVTFDLVDGVAHVDHDQIVAVFGAAGWSQRATPARLAEAERAAVEGAE